MTYAVKQDLIDRFSEDELVQLSNPEGETIDDIVVARALADADAEINPYVQSRYELPLASVPPRLVLCACNLARYRLYKDRPTEQVRQAYVDDIAWLKDVASGKASLGLDAAGAETAAETGTVDYSAEDRVFDRETLADY